MSRLHRHVDCTISLTVEALMLIDCNVPLFHLALPIQCVEELASPAPQHILDHLDNFISFFSITMASLMTFKSFDTHYLTLEWAVTIRR